MAQSTSPLDVIARHALTLVPDGAVVGLGTGRAATAFLHALGDTLRTGLRVRGVPTSRATAALARQLGIPLATPDDVEHVDVAVDGADEVDPAGNLIKGYGGALLREKVVATIARRLVILVGPEKLVPVLGSRGKLAVEVVAFALAPVRRQLAGLGLDGSPRVDRSDLFVTDNGNHLLDCRVGLIEQPGELEAALRAIPGVVGTGLFVDFGPTVLIEREGEVEVREHGRKAAGG